MTKKEIFEWLLAGDVAIQYQVYRDLLDSRRVELQNRIEKEGWGKQFLSLRNSNGQWGLGFYQPKWTSTHYTLLDLLVLGISPECRLIKDTCNIITATQKGHDGGINPSGTINESDVCINGMALNYLCYFNTPETELKSIVHFILSQHMSDGGFNCRSNRSGARHSSLHTTPSVLEGIHQYKINRYTYRIEELLKASRNPLNLYFNTDYLNLIEPVKLFVSNSLPSPGLHAGDTIFLGP